MLNRLKNQLIARVITRFPGLAQRFIAAYQPWESGEPVPWTPVSKPLRDCRVAIVTTSGVHHKSQQPFDMQDSEGDPSFREIDGATISKDYLITHDYYDHSDAEKDLNIVLPLDRLRELQDEGVIGDLASRHYSLMGHIDGRHIVTLISKSAGKIIANLRQDAVDVVLLTPAWGICNQSVGLVQREIEKAGIPTVGVSIVREYTEKVQPPRTVYVKWPFGHPLGEPGNTRQQRAVILESFRVLYSATTPGEIVDLPFRWRRYDYASYEEPEEFVPIRQ